MEYEWPVLPETSCGCYHCLRIFPYKTITEFWDEGRTPVCPYCGVDSIAIATEDMSITLERLKAMHDQSF